MRLEAAPPEVARDEKSDGHVDVWHCEPPRWGQTFIAKNVVWVHNIERHIYSWESPEKRVKCESE